MNLRIAALLLVSGTAEAVVADSAAESDFHSYVASTYDFSPHTLSAEEIARHSDELDKFWSVVKGMGPAGLVGLRGELAASGHKPFFYYDGAMLLTSISKTRPDRELALRAIVKADLKDIQSTDYLRTVHSFAVDELDTTDAAFKILEIDDFKAFVPLHSLELDQELCLHFMLIPTQERFWLARAEKHLFNTGSVVAQKSLLSLLAHSATPSGDAAIRRFAKDTTKPKNSRDLADRILKAIPEMRSQSIVGFSMDSYDVLKQEQRVVFRRISDEALYEWERLRIKIRRKAPYSE